MLELKRKRVLTSFSNKKDNFRLNKATNTLVKVDTVDLQEQINSCRPTALETLLNACLGVVDQETFARKRNIDKLDELSEAQAFAREFAVSQGLPADMPFDDILKVIDKSLKELGVSTSKNVENIEEKGDVDNEKKIVQESQFAKFSPNCSQDSQKESN